MINEVFQKTMFPDTLDYYNSPMRTNIKNHCGQCFIIALMADQIREFSTFRRVLLTNITGYHRRSNPILKRKKPWRSSLHKI